MSWDKGHQHSHCIFSFSLLIALLGEFPEEEVRIPSSAYLLRSCVKLESIMLESLNVCGIVSMTKTQRHTTDDTTSKVMSAALIASQERGYLEGEIKGHKLDFYGWLLCWCCGYWAIQDCFKMCVEFNKKISIKWLTFKEAMEEIDRYIEGYEDKFPELQEDAWTIYEVFLEITKDKRLPKR